MIFLTTGTQLPFDRLVQTMDEIAPKLGAEDVFAQIGSASYKPKYFQSVATLAPEEFSKRFQQARLVVGHAGIGTILNGKKFSKPLALMARRRALGEHRNDHQMATMRLVSSILGVYSLDTAGDLLKVCTAPFLTSMSTAYNPTRTHLIEALHAEIMGQGPSKKL